MLSRGGTTLTDSWYNVKEVTELNAVQSTVDRIYTTDLPIFGSAFITSLTLENPSVNGLNLVQGAQRNLHKAEDLVQGWRTCGPLSFRDRRFRLIHDYALERLESYFNIKNEMVLESKSSLLITAHKVPGVYVIQPLAPPNWRQSEVTLQSSPLAASIIYESDMEDWVLLHIRNVQRRQRRENIKMFRRQLRDTLNPFELLESEFKQLFRMSRRLALDLCDMLSPHLEGQRSNRILANKRVPRAASHSSSGGLLDLRRPSESFDSAAGEPIGLNHVEE
uniref:Uncharacterized protein n=1 Tax=Timema poppense TaxID=170557 RepID=A0A7R9H893_TIMPO|nr:unnamed protein product [Timema poppensis]